MVIFSSNHLGKMWSARSLPPTHMPILSADSLLILPVRLYRIVAREYWRWPQSVLNDFSYLNCWIVAVSLQFCNSEAGLTA